MCNNCSKLGKRYIKSINPRKQQPQGREAPVCLLSSYFYLLHIVFSKFAQLLLTKSAPRLFWPQQPRFFANNLGLCYSLYNTYIHTYIHTYVRTYVRTYVCTYAHTHIHTYIHTFMHACITALRQVPKLKFVKS